METWMDIEALAEVSSTILILLIRFLLLISFHLSLVWFWGPDETSLNGMAMGRRCWNKKAWSSFTGRHDNSTKHEPASQWEKEISLNVEAYHLLGS